MDAELTREQIGVECDDAAERSKPLLEDGDFVGTVHLGDVKIAVRWSMQRGHAGAFTPSLPPRLAEAPPPRRRGPRARG